MEYGNIGAISKVEIPQAWSDKHSSSSARIGLAWERRFTSGGLERVEITFRYRGVPIDEASRKVFNFLLAQGKLESLDREQILALHTVLGVATIGDNQYTNHSEPGSLEGPRFEVQSASVEQISGKNVLRVTGEFVNSLYYDGVFYPAGVGGRVVEELFLQAPTVVKELGQIKADYQSVLDSISWR